MHAPKASTWFSPYVYLANGAPCTDRSRIRPLARRFWRLWLAIAVALSGAFVAVEAVDAAGVNQDEEIVYIDPAGVIRVFDPIQTADNRPVQWFSPDGGWMDLALGDVTGDGSKEIVAVGHGEEGGGKLAIFDPVYIGTNPVPGQRINDIAWVTYFQTQFATLPSFVETGQFEGGHNLAQIVVSRPLAPAERTNPEHRHRLQIWRAGGSPPNPSAWSVIATYDSIYEWDWIAAGDYTGNGLDEVALIDRQRGHLGVFRLGANRTLERIFANESAERPWQTVAFGQYAISTVEEMIAVRHSGAINNYWIFRWVNNQTTDFFSALFLPPPDYAFLADIGGNGDVEIVTLRAVPPEMGERPRLFVRDNDTDPIALREAPLDADNGFRAGVGADLSADGRDAIVLIRDNRIRIYYEPYRNRDYFDHPLATNQRTVHAGNLDAAGQQPIPRLEVAPRSLNISLIQGQVDSSLRAEVLSEDVEGTLDFTAMTQAADAWLSVAPSGGQTPATLSIGVDARNLNPGSYSGDVTVSSQSFGLLQSVDLEVSINVNAGIWLSPASAVVYYAPCDEDASLQNLAFTVAGASGTAVRAELFPQAAWISVEPDDGNVPEVFTVTLLPDELLSSDDAEATLVVEAVNNPSPTFRAEASIRLLCRDNFVYLPTVQSVVD